MSVQWRLAQLDEMIWAWRGLAWRGQAWRGQAWRG